MNIYNFAKSSRVALLSLTTFMVATNCVVWADCQPTVPATPVTVNDETANSAESRQLVNGAGTTVDTSTPGQIKVSLPASGVAAGTYTNPSLTVDTYGRITAASNGSSGGGAFDGRLYINQPDGFGVNTRDVVGGTAGSYSGSIANGAISGNYLTNRVTTAATSGSIGSITAANPITAFLLKPIWSCAASPHIITSARYWFGLYDSALSGTDSPTANFAAFRASTSAGDATYQFVTSDGSGTITATNTGISFTADTPHEFKIDMTGYPSSITASIDGAVVATNTTHLPGASTQLYQSPTVTTLTSSAAAADIGFIVCSSEGSQANAGGVSSVSAADSTLNITPNQGAVTAKVSSSVSLSGSPTTTTQSPLDSSTKIATTAYVDAAVTAGSSNSDIKWQGFTSIVPTWEWVPSAASNNWNSVTTVSGIIGNPGYANNGTWANNAIGWNGKTVITNNFTSAASANAQANVATNNSNVAKENYPAFSVLSAISSLTNVRAWVSYTNVGFLNDTPIDSTGFRYSTAVGDVHWMAYSSDHTTSTTIDTGITPDGGVHLFQIVLTPTNTTYYYDGVLVATQTSHLTTTAMGWGTSVEALTSSPVTVTSSKLILQLP